MQYDFTSILDRRGRDALAVDGLGTGFAPAPPKEGFDRSEERRVGKECM